MSPEESIQIFVALNLIVMGLSHFLRPEIWIEFFVYLHKKGNVGNILNAMLSVGMGSIILSFHLVWKWPMILVTFYGVLQLIKGLLFLTFPTIGLKSIGRVNESSTKYRWIGLIMLLLAMLLLYLLIGSSNKL